jgi:hypothetical protein
MSYDLKLLAIHKEAHQDLVKYFKILLSDQDNYKEPAKFHYILSDILLKENTHCAVEMFRESAKSAYVLKAYPIYKLNYPTRQSRYIVIIKQNQDLASAKLTEIITEYKTNKATSFNLLQTHKESAQVFEATVRGKGFLSTRVRIEAYGKGASVRGLSWNNQRPQIIIADDIQDLEDSQSDTVLEKDWNWWLSDVMFLAKTGRVFIIGNNLGQKCIIERIAKSTLGFKMLKIPAIDDKGEATWPQQFSKEFLEKEKQKYAEIGKLDIWYRERMCRTVSPEMQKFKYDKVKYYTEKDLEGKIVNNYILVDRAYSTARTADFTGIIVLSVDLMNNWYIRLAKRFKGKTDNPEGELIKYLFGLIDIFKPLKTGIEQKAFKYTFKTTLENEMRKRDKFFIVEELKDLGKNKAMRIEGLLPRFESGSIYFKTNHTELLEELYNFPTSEYDDLSDALAYGLELAEAPTRVRAPKDNWETISKYEEEQERQQQKIVMPLPVQPVEDEDKYQPTSVYEG